jgi:hypothetical protein
MKIKQKKDLNRRSRSKKNEELKNKNKVIKEIFLKIQAYQK